MLLLLRCFWHFGLGWKSEMANFIWVLKDTSWCSAKKTVKARQQVLNHYRIANNKCSCKETAQVFTVKWSHDRFDCLLTLFPWVHSLSCQGIFGVNLWNFYWTAFRFESTCMFILYILFWSPILKMH